MTARKPLEEGCTGGIFCPVPGHLKKNLSRARTRISHIPLTHGQHKTLMERRRVEREAIQ